MKEIWKAIEDTNGEYEVSNLGNVRQTRILKQWNHDKGYLCVNIKGKHKYVHRLVAQAFLDNPNNLPAVNHKDEVKNNNKVSNLEWISIKDNNCYGTVLKRRSKTRSLPVLQISLDGEVVKEWESAREIQRVLGISNVCINQCCLGKIKKSHGYYWRYK